MKNILKQHYGLLKDGYPIQLIDIEDAFRLLSEYDRIRLKDFYDIVFIDTKDHHVKPRSMAQKEYVDAIRSNDILYTGKYYEKTN